MIGLISRTNAPLENVKPCPYPLICQNLLSFCKIAVNQFACFAEGRCVDDRCTADGESSQA